VLGQRLAADGFFVIPRQTRAYAFDRMGIPVTVRPSRATVFRIAEEMDVDLIVLGNYTFDGRTFAARAQVNGRFKLHLSPETVETGALTQLMEILKRSGMGHVAQPRSPLREIQE